eukprot:Seg1790.3 transcript_id=Seg1790.3/GoldUCD/mRNA.D3Y31 product="Zinc finger protein 76" protein_id=Seg1790.3/GoldUCD/D3Y31
MFFNGVSGKRIEPTSCFQSPEHGFARLHPVTVTDFHSQEKTAGLDLPQPFTDDEIQRMRHTRMRYRDDKEGGGPRVTESEMEVSESFECGQVYPGEDSDQTIYHDFDAPKNELTSWGTAVAANVAAVQPNSEESMLPLISVAQSERCTTPAVVTEAVKTIQCSFPNCPKIFSRNDLLKHHYDTIHGRKKIECNICSGVFRDKSDLKRHKSSFHSRFPFKCDVSGCGKDFSSTNGFD